MKRRRGRMPIRVVTAFFALLIVSLCIWPHHNTFADTGKVVSVAGGAFVEEVKGSQAQWRPLKQGEGVEEGEKVRTDASGEVRLVFPGELIVQVLNNSEVVVTKNQNEQQTIPIVDINQGFARVQTASSSSHLGDDQNDLSLADIFSLKAVVRTKTMLVQGGKGDFLIGYNPYSAQTITVGLKGDAITMPFGNKDFNPFVSLEKAPEAARLKEKMVILTVAGGTTPQLETSKVAPSQLQTLRQVFSGVQRKDFQEPSMESSYVSPLAPGVDHSTVSPQLAAENGMHILFQALGLEAELDVKKKKKAHPTHPEHPVHPSHPTASRALPGGYVSLQAVVYIPPPSASLYDENAGVFLASPDFGRIDPSTGDFIPPAGFEISPKKGLVPAPKDRSSYKSNPMSTAPKDYALNPVDRAEVLTEIAKTSASISATSQTIDVLTLVQSSGLGTGFCLQCLDQNAVLNSATSDTGLSFRLHFD